MLFYLIDVYIIKKKSDGFFVTKLIIMIILMLYW